MTEWDPYYLTRGMLRPLTEDDKRRRGERTHARIVDEKARRKEVTEAESEGLDAMSAPAAAELHQIKRERLEALEAANAAALTRNAEEMEIARAQIVDLLERALTLPDGRRVFRTEDGARLIDEHGEEVPADEIDPGSISDAHPTWEEYQAAREEEARLEQEREELLERQEELDQAREKLDAGNLTVEELDALEADLGPSMADLGRSADASTEPAPRAQDLQLAGP